LDPTGSAYVDWNARTPIVEWARSELRRIVAAEGISHVEISVSARALRPEEAIGNPRRRDFPIIAGVERVIEAAAMGARGHAFTDAPSDFRGTIGEVLSLDLSASRNRALFIAALNAVLRHLGRADRVLHCVDEDPERCALHIAGELTRRFAGGTVGLVGLNPAIAEALVGAFGAGNVRVTDLNPDAIGTRRFGVEIWGGADRTEELVEFADVVLITGTTLVNGTFDRIRELADAASKEYLVYGVTSAGISALSGIDRICPYGRDG
jgi:hypothetical protein